MRALVNMTLVICAADRRHGQIKAAQPGVGAREDRTENVTNP
jgi:hypothetical protein